MVLVCDGAAPLRDCRLRYNRGLSVRRTRKLRLPPGLVEK